jgi:hypothetical protein
MLRSSYDILWISPQDACEYWKTAEQNAVAVRIHTQRRDRDAVGQLYSGLDTGVLAHLPSDVSRQPVQPGRA